MYCFRCGTKVEKEIKYCTHCGANLLEEQQHYNYKTPETIENTHEDQYNYSKDYSNVDQSLEKAFIGKNYEQLMTTRFSFPAFLFGGYYFLYRKLYLYGILLILANLIMLIVIPELYLIWFIINIILGTYFNKIYQNFINKKIKRLKEINTSSSNTDLINLCKRKGGTNIAIIIISNILVFIIVFISVFTYEFVKIWNEEFASNTNATPTIEEATYKVPEGFKKNSYSNKAHKSYYYEKSACNITLETNNATTLYPTAESYLKSNIYTSQNDVVSPMQVLNINNTAWNYMEIKSTYSIKHIYATLYNDTIYKVEYSIYSYNGSKCQDKLTPFINSIKFN